MGWVGTGWGGWGRPGGDRVSWVGAGWGWWGRVGLAQACYMMHVGGPFGGDASSCTPRAVNSPTTFPDQETDQIFPIIMDSLSITMTRYGFYSHMYRSGYFNPCNSPNVLPFNRLLNLWTPENRGVVAGEHWPAINDKGMVYVGILISGSMAIFW